MAGGKKTRSRGGGGGAPTSIDIRGARAHNLKSIDVELPRDKLVVITGLSGSGKSSLAFDTLYAEGQRRYVESLSSYARQFLGLMEKPDVDSIEGLSPAISIDQKAVSHNPRSTVGTGTEIYDYLRLLWAHVGLPHCTGCGKPIKRRSLAEIVDALIAEHGGKRAFILGPVVRGRKGEYQALFKDMARQGFARVRVDGRIHDLESVPDLARYKVHHIEVVVDRLKLEPERRLRVAEAVETAMELGRGLIVVHFPDQGLDANYSDRYACIDCGVYFDEPAPRIFSFNSPYGACPVCNGLGTLFKIDPELVVPDPKLSLDQGAIAPFANTSTTYYRKLLDAVAAEKGIDTAAPFKKLPARQRALLLNADESIPVRFRFRTIAGRYRSVRLSFRGVLPNLERRHRDTESVRVRDEIEKYMSLQKCPACGGARLKPEALAYEVGGKNIHESTLLPVRDALEFFGGLELDQRRMLIAERILKEVVDRLRFMADVGLEYMTLDRNMGTLSGGEAQRVRLATQIGASLMGVLYVLDEPSIGLHQRDNERLIATLKRLRDLGNTVVVVEHDEGTMRAADHLVDLGPGAGELGGEVVAAGTADQVARAPESITGRYLAGVESIPLPERRRTPGPESITVLGAEQHNLRAIDVEFPLGTLICVTGVSGSGKSTLVHDILYKGLARALYRAKDKPGPHRDIQGIEHIDKAAIIDQSPIGRTPRSNPVTYTKAFDGIRNLFSLAPEARARGYKPGRFSFNVSGGRCDACNGDGVIKIEMHFLPDMYIPCEVCKGKRYNRETLEVTYKGANIAAVLDMTVHQAMEFFDAHPGIHRKLKTLCEVGLGYIRLGQPAPTLSGGEAQRIKLSSELGKRATGRTLYILDEPTTGLHFDDIKKLLAVLGRIVDAGNTVIVIEHNLDVIKTADWIIDLGPEGGDGGGTLLAAGPPEKIARSRRSHTGRFLKPLLGKTTSKPKKPRSRS